MARRGDHGSVMRCTARRDALARGAVRVDLAQGDRLFTDPLSR